MLGLPLDIVGFRALRLDRCSVGHHRRQLGTQLGQITRDRRDLGVGVLDLPARFGELGFGGAPGEDRGQLLGAERVVVCAP